MSVNPDELSRQRRRAYDQTLAKLVPTLNAPVPSRAPQDGGGVDLANVARIAALVGDARGHGAATADALGAIGDPASVIVDAVVRLYMVELNIPLSAELFELVRATVNFTYGFATASTSARVE